MSNQQTSKRSLTANIMILLTCIAMLIIATYAWFTDSASTSGNRIQAGNLNVALYMKNSEGNWESAEGKTIDFVKAAGSTETSILWEPGCTYTLPELKIVNEGNLALKYKVQITGIIGDAKLNNAISWTIGDAAQGTEQRLVAGASNEFTISGHMDENAGNEYQGLSIDGISITVVATQDTVESDSYSKDYDDKAVYPVAPELGNATESGTIKASETTTLGNMSDTNSPSAAQIEIPTGAVSSDTDAVFTMNLTSSNSDSVTYEINLKDNSGTTISLSSPAKVTAKIGANLSNVSVKHNDQPMTAGSSADKLNDGQYYYDSQTGTLTICTSSFSPFTICYTYDPVASINGQGYTTIQSAIDASKDGDTVVITKDYTCGNVTFDQKNITLDLNNKVLTLNSSNAIQYLNGSNAVVKNGTINAAYAGIATFRQHQGVTVNLENIQINCNFIGVWGDTANCTFNIKNSVINSKYIGIYQNGSYGGNTFTIDNTTVSDSTGAGIYISNSVNNAKQNLTITNSTISGPTGVEIKHTNANVTDSTLIGTSTPTDSAANNNGTTTDGYAFAVTSNGVSDQATGNVTLTNCTFYNGTNQSEGYVFVYEVAEGSSVIINGSQVTNYDTYNDVVE